MKNPYIIRSRISSDKFREILKLFSLDIEATKIAKITNISRNSTNKIINEIRTLIPPGSIPRSLLRSYK